MAILVKSKTPADDKAVKLLRAELIKRLHYDQETGVFTKKVKLSRNCKVGDEAGYVTHNGYLFVGLLGKQYFAHRLVILYVHGFLPECVDHANGNKLDNRLSNLRVCSRQQNCFNMAMSKANTSGHKGVSWSKQKGKWEVRIRAQGKRHHLGFYDSLAEAAEVAASERARLHGEFANNGHHTPIDGD